MKIYSQQNLLILDVDVDDTSYRHREIMGENSLTLYFSLPEYKEIPVGSFCRFEGSRYVMILPAQLKKMHNRQYDYTIVLHGEDYYSHLWKFRNPVDGRLRFPLTAKPIEHLQMFVDNMNLRDSGWQVGECISDVEKLINYDHDYCYDALAKIASEFETEFEIINKRVSLHKIEHDKNNPLPLSYGRGNGILSGLGRQNNGDVPPIEVLYVQGGDRNIDRTKYEGRSELHLPIDGELAYDGQCFEDQDGFNSMSARLYKADHLGLSIRRADKPLSSVSEASLDRSDDYPKRIGHISRVIPIQTTNGYLYDFEDASIPDNLNYKDCQIGEEHLSVVFQDGMLAGREFDVNYDHERKRFEIVPQEIDGMTMPGEAFVPENGNSYAIFGCMLPDAYINAYDNTDPNSRKEGAEWDMMRAAVKYLYENEEQKITFPIELDGIWSKKDWENRGGRIQLGGYILFHDPAFQPEGILVRIIGIKEYINKPYSPQIELSNETISPSFSTTLNEIRSSQCEIEQTRKDSIQYTKRRFRDAKETMSMLIDAFADNFTSSINPVAVETMQLLIGDERLQFRFVDTIGNDVSVKPHSVRWDAQGESLIVTAGLVQHMTLGLSKDITVHDGCEYVYFGIPGRELPCTDKANKYFLYIHATTANPGVINNAEFRHESVPHSFRENGEYWLLYGILNSEYEGDRSFVALNGFTEILPGRITADRIVSSDGNSWFDMPHNSFKLGDKLEFQNETLKLKGTLVQSQSGEISPMGCFRGEYNEETMYYNGDEVTYTFRGETSTYRHTGRTCQGIVPINTDYWSVVAKGQNGNDGKSPAFVFRGQFDLSKTYYGTESRIDCVKYGNAYYVTTPSTMSVSGEYPNNSDKWQSFGGSFESVATGLLLAEFANVGGWILKDNLLISQKGKINGEDSENFEDPDFVPNIVLDGVDGAIRQGNNISIDKSGISLMNDSGSVVAKMVNKSIGKEVDLGKQRGTFTYDVSDSMQIATSQMTASKIESCQRDIGIGLLLNGSYLEFQQVTTSFTLPSANGLSYFRAILTAKLIKDGEEIRTLKTSVKNVPSGNQSIIASEPIRINITADNEGYYAIRLELEVYFSTTGAISTSPFSVILATTVEFEKAGFNKTLIGRDGFFSCTGENRYIFSSPDGIALRFGDNVLRIDDSGIYKNGNRL